MLHTVVKKNFYQDSITLMVLTKEISKLHGVSKVSIMMATPANKEIMVATGFKTKDLENAGANDIAIVLNIKDETIKDVVLAEITNFFNKQTTQMQSQEASNSCNSWHGALAYPNTNIVMLSIPGQYVYMEAKKALASGKHVFIFSDNVTIEEELRLKLMAEEKGLLVMGPDCGTAIIGGIPLAFANEVTSGSIAIVGASGTGIQEVSSLISNKGSGIYCAIGVGGRDLNEEINGIAMKNALYSLASNNNISCIVVISKPPAVSVRNEILQILRAISKPSVTVFLGEEAEFFEAGLYSASTLEEAAEIATLIDKGEKPNSRYMPKPLSIPVNMKGKKIRGYYAGGTLAKEAAFLLGKALNIKAQKNLDKGFMLDYNGHTIIDLGDDFYTQGKPHPMIDPENRIKLIKELIADVNVGIVLFDIVLGHGAHNNMAAALVPAITHVLERCKSKGREITFIAVITGTLLDKQDIKKQQSILEKAGVIVAFSNTEGVVTAIDLIGEKIVFAEKRKINNGEKLNKLPEPVSKIKALLKAGPIPINIGLKSFVTPFEEKKCPYVQFNWQPAAGGDVHLQKMLAFLDNYVQKDALEEATNETF